MRLIDADELKKNFQDELCKGIACAECSIQVEGFCRVERWIDIAPTIEAEPVKHGRWKPFDLTWGRSVYACTNCGEAFEVPTEDGKPIYDYCPKCGAKMDEPEAEP